MSDLAELKRRYEAVRVTEDSKNEIIKASLTYNVAIQDLLTGCY